MAMKEKTPAEKAAWGVKMKLAREAKKRAATPFTVKQSAPAPVVQGNPPAVAQAITPVEVKPEMVNYFCRREIKINGKKYMGLVTVAPKLAQTLACIDDKADAEKARATQNETHPLQPVRRGGVEIIL